MKEKTIMTKRERNIILKIFIHEYNFLENLEKNVKKSKNISFIGTEASDLADSQRDLLYNIFECSEKKWDELIVEAYYRATAPTLFQNDRKNWKDDIIKDAIW